MKGRTKTVGIKIKFYIMSLWLLFIFLFLLTFKFYDEEHKFIGIKDIVCDNIVSIGAIIFALIGIILSTSLKRKFKGVENPPYKILKIKNENYEYLTFLTTYIIPLVCIDLNNARYIIVLVALLLVIGFIFVKTDLYMGNPTLALLGYRLYRIEVETKKGSLNDILVISKDKLNVNEYIAWIEIDENNWHVRRIQNDS